MKHHFKNPRYRICFQTKTKVWAYKNSRLRNFYKLRGKIVLKSGKFMKRFLITKNMKWTVARRQMVPYFKNRQRFFYFYKNLFFIKQSLKNFYGGLKEYQIRNIFKNTWNKEQYLKTNIFLGALEQRLSVVLFRMRLLPTIFACNQLITHHGILVNTKRVTLVNFRITIGDVVTISHEHWYIFFEYLFERMQYRFFGHALLFWRKQFFLKKIRFYRLKKKYVFFQNFRLKKKFYKQKKRVKLVKKFLRYLFKFVQKRQNLSLFEKRAHLKSLKILYITLYKKILIPLKKTRKYLKFLHKWSRPQYFSRVNTLIFKIYNIKFLVTKFSSLVFKLLYTWMIQNYYIFWQTNSGTNFENTKLKFFTFFRIVIKAIHTKNLINVENKFLIKRKIHRYIIKRYKKVRHVKSKLLRNKRYFNFLIRKLKYKRAKKKLYKGWCKTAHWYTPHYLEVDYPTLRATFVYYPKVSEVFFGFSGSFKKIVSFYKERAL